MTILGLETSTAVCSVGLVREKKPDGEQSLQESHIHSEKLLTLIQDVLQTGETTLRQVDAISISIGPGSFTGLRIGLSTAKGLSYALGKPLIAVPTFEAMAEAARQHHRGMASIVVIMDAKKDEWYTCKFHVVSETVQAAGPVEIRTLPEAIAAVDGAPTIILTDSCDVVRRHLKTDVVVEDVHPFCKGNVVAQLGYRKLIKNEFSDVAALEPMYLKDFIIRSAALVS
jgi:tRNA threonylcarbamoyladenosine biosynthesis protein TsaB